MPTQRMQAQKLLTRTVQKIWRCGEFPHSGHSISSEQVESKPHVRCSWVQRSRRGTNRTHAGRPMQVQKIFVSAVSDVRQCRKLCQVSRSIISKSVKFKRPFLASLLKNPDAGIAERRCPRERTRLLIEQSSAVKTKAFSKIFQIQGVNLPDCPIKLLHLSPNLMS
jgi:hypothetical protein